MPSTTVENYLKAIHQAEQDLPSPDDLVPMGRLAAMLGVVPGTATTMVRALARSGLADYERYRGVRLTPSGRRLAGLVLRRHRLVELFLVQVMGMSWDEVHDEAESLEHAISDRLIDRIDVMLGHPATDPHGDPIPDAEGLLPSAEVDTLLSCPLHAQVRVKRVLDQDVGFLRFVEQNGLEPERVIEVEERDGKADSVRLRHEDGTTIVLGMRAASKLLVEKQNAG
jgi:DtxR family Mn-dependent transcriptional regulator